MSPPVNDYAFIRENHENPLSFGQIACNAATQPALAYTCTICTGNDSVKAAKAHVGGETLILASIVVPLIF